MSESARRQIRHVGHAVSYRDVGPADAPVVLLIHGLASDSGTWDLAIGPLVARGLRVVAPDLIGHGESAKPALPYSLERFADCLRDLLDELGIARATLVGHSLGGAVAMHFAYHYPAYTERLVLVASGGLGKRVHPLLRAATLPGARTVVRLLVNRRTAAIYGAPRLHRTLRLPPGTVTNLRRAGRGLATPDGRAAFFATLHSVIEPSGQRGSLIEMDYLAQHTPTLIVWTEGDRVVPISHAYALHEHLPTSRLEVFPGSSHEAHRRFPERFADVVADFIATSDPAPAR